MAEIVKTNEDLKFNSGNNFQIEGPTAGEYITLGKVESGNILFEQGSQEAGFGDGTGYDGPGRVKARFEVVLSQVSADIVTMLFRIMNKLKFAYYDNGVDIGGKRMHIYIPELTLMKRFKIGGSGEEHQVIALEGTIAPQDGDAVCTPDNDLPAGTLTGAVEQTSYNPFIVVMNEAAAEGGDAIPGGEGEPEP